WAYGDAGVEIPRLAQEQDVGAQVAQSDLMPGDLAVWDGHVAMYIGNDQLVEAGDPVSVSGLRTDNIGIAFQGFYRPTGGGGRDPAVTPTRRPEWSPRSGPTASPWAWHCRTGSWTAPRRTSPAPSCGPSPWPPPTPATSSSVSR